VDDQTRFQLLFAVVHVHGGRQHRGPVLLRVVDEQYLLSFRQRAVLAGRVLDRVRRHVDHLTLRALGRVAVRPAAEAAAAVQRRLAQRSRRQVAVVGDAASAAVRRAVPLRVQVVFGRRTVPVAAGHESFVIQYVVFVRHVVVDRLVRAQFFIRRLLV